MYNNSISLVIINDKNTIGYPSPYFLYFLEISKVIYFYFLFLFFKKYKKYREEWTIIFISLAIANDIILLYIIILIQRVFHLDVGTIQIQILFGLFIFYFRFFLIVFENLLNIIIYIFIK